MHAITHPSDLTVALDRTIATMSLVLEAMEREMCAMNRSKEKSGAYAALCESVVERTKGVYWPTLDGVFAALQDMREACAASEKSA